MNTQSLLSLLHLTSPGLPIGAFAYSQGLETAVEISRVHDEASLLSWLTPLILQGQAHLEVPLLKRCYQAWQNEGIAQVQHWQAVLMANRETAELVTEEQQLGQTFSRLMRSLDIPLDETRSKLSYLPLYALACVHFHIGLQEAATGWLWAWSENQVMAACKTVPLGQTSAQKVLIHLMPVIEQAIEDGLNVEDDDIGLTLPGFAMVSSWHETQYSRLFRS